MSNFINNLFNLNGKLAVVTGAGGHLCSEMAKGLAKAGCSIVVIDIRKEKAELVAKEIQLLDMEVLALQVDVSNKREVEQSLSDILERFNSVDILINGAGINSPTPFLEIEIDEYKEVMNSQITSTLVCCQVFGKHMLEKSKGSIINISSASAGPPLSKAFTYSIAKAGILNLTQNLGREWGTKGVRVNAVRPGFFPTEWNRKNFITKDREISILNHTPMERFGEVKELLGGIIYLASDASSFVTGSELTIDGGFSAMTI